MCEYRGMSTLGTVVHIVLTQWRGDAPSESIAQMRELIRRFSAEIPGIVSVVEGPSVSPERLEGGFEWALVVTFESAAARDGYLDHPTHLPVAALIGECAEHVIVFDVSV